MLSIAIPTYECHGKGWLYLTELLNSIVKQTYKDVEIVISDQSYDDNIKNLSLFYSNFLNIKYLNSRNLKRSNSVNSNNAIKNCSGKIIKIMFMDDFFINVNSIQMIVDAMEQSNAHWCINGSVECNESIHLLYNKLIPRYNDQIHLGKNTISSPSVLTLNSKEYFDEFLLMLMDCELYKRLYIKYGNPIIISEPLICNRSHEHQLQKKIKSIPSEELNYCIHKYD